MKKIYSFVALMFTCCVGNVSAQSDWTQGKQVTADDIKEGQTYVIAAGDNTLAETDETTGANKAGGNAKYSGKYINSTQKGLAEDITDGCVFTFVKTGELKNESYPVYVLRNQANGLFLAGNFKYADNRAEAYQLTVRDAELKEEPEGNKQVGDAQPAWSWDVYSNAASSTRSILAQDNGAVILCLANTPSYLTFSNGANPDNHGWIDTNNWLIYEVSGSEMSAEDKFTGIYDKYFGNYIEDETFPVGNQPGCVSEDFAKHIKEVNDKAYNILVDKVEDMYESVGQEIIDLFEKEIPAAIIPVKPGFYVLRNVDGRGFLTVTDDGKKARGSRTLISNDVAEGTTYEDWTPAQMTAWNLNNVKNIWQVEKAKENGKLLFKNFGTGQYLTTGNDFAMAEEGSSFVSKNFSGKEFYLAFGNGGVVHMRNSGDHLLMNYAHPEDKGSRFVYFPIENIVIDTMSVKVNQRALNDELKAALDEANTDYYGNQYLNFVPGDLYKDSVDAGLVDSVLQANASAGPSESKSALNHLFDSDMESYYHTAWKAEEVADVHGTNWIQVDLGKKVSKLVIKFSKRQKAANNHISQYALYTAEEGQSKTDVWTKFVEKSADSIEFAYGKNNTHIAEYDLKEPVQYLRFEVTQTRGRDTASWNAKAGESGPFWHMSEFRCYDAEDFKKNPAYDQIPEGVKENLLTAIKNGEALLTEKKATPEAIKDVKENLKKFWEAYPDASGLKKDLENAADLAKYATEKEVPTMGFYPKGATQELLDVVNKVAAAVKDIEENGKALSLQQIKDYTAEVDAAIAAFSKKLVKPEAGKVYFIVSKSIVSNQEAPQVNACVASIDADVKNGTPVFRYKQDGTESLDERLNALWLAVETKDGLAFKNLANGLYMNNVYEGLTEEELDSLELPNNQIGYSETPKSFTLESFSNEDYAEEGYFVMSLMKGQYVNFQQTGKVMVHYEERNDANAPLTFVEAENEIDFVGSYHIDVEPNQIQILSYPIAFESIYTESGNGAYEVVGRNGDFIMLQPIEDVIPAGTPFIINTRVAEGEEPQNKIEAMVNKVTSLEGATQLTYNYKPETKGGLVSTPQRVVLGDGFGILVNNMVIPSKAGASVPAGKGFFNKELQNVDDETEFMIPVDGVISGEGDATAVENIQIVKNVPTDVYTLSGVKVRHNVKLSNATEGLPKGIYIVGGKKVVVK